MRSNKATCDVCGWVYYRSELVRDGKGRLVCSRDYDPPHPLDFYRPPRELPRRIDTNGDREPVFLTEVCTSESRSALAGSATAGCALAGMDLT